MSKQASRMWREIEKVFDVCGVALRVSITTDEDTRKFVVETLWADADEDGLSWDDESTETFSGDSLVDCLWKAIVLAVDPDAVKGESSDE